MKKLNLENDIKPLSEFRAKAASILDYVKKEQRPILITQNGKGSGVLLSVREYEEMIENIEIAKDVEMARADFKNGRTKSHEEVIAYLKTTTHQK